MLVLAIKLIDSLTQSLYKRQEVSSAKLTGFSDVFNRAIAMISKDFQVFIN
ncbi:hypothetical protein H6F42_02910 [Pseudanabaena sp. FACHB-1998]|nr:hypothetical protein [Pseudanabaena sp. FACHB-1998]